MRITAVAIAALLAASPALADEKLDNEVEKAEKDLAKGKPEDAVKRMSKFADKNPSGAAWLALAEIQARAGHVERGGIEAAAVSAAQGVRVASPGVEKAHALAGLSRFDLMRGTGADALRHARDAVEAHSDATTLAALARAQVRAQDFASAVTTARHAVSAGARSPEAHESLGEALLGGGGAEDAAAAFRRALELDAGHGRARIGLAAALSRAGRHAEAIAMGREATAANPWSAEAFATLGLAILAEAPEDVQHLNEAIGEAQQGRFLNPRSVFAQYAVGRIFEARGDVNQAELAYQSASDVDPGYAPARVGLIQMKVIKRDLAGATAEARQLVQEAPSSALAHLQLGRVLMRASDFVNALDSLEKAAQLAPGLAEAQALLGTTYQYNRRTAEALEAYRRATEAAPGNNEYRTSYGLLLGMNGRHAEGVAELEKVISDPAYEGAAAWVNLGWIHRNSRPRNPDASVAAYEKALQVDPENAQAALGLGWAYSYVQPRQWNQAIASFRKAIELDDALAGEAWSGLGWVHFFNEDVEQATEALDEARSRGRFDRRLAANIERVITQKDAMERVNAYQQLENGMSYEQVQELLGEPGEETEREAGIVTYQWTNPDDTYVVAVFEADKLIDKLHTGIEDWGGEETEGGAEGEVPEGEAPEEGETPAGTGSSARPSARPAAQEAWYTGGTLHEKTVAEWRTASAGDRLATSADFVMTVGKYQTLPSDLRKRAADLQTCISEAVAGGQVDHQNVSEIAATCAVLMGY
jgi:tetratricopeptide (TPR) repeat protein